jgi:hypothetical protein
VELSGPVTLLNTPEVVPLTLTDSVHDFPAARLAPLNPTEVEFAAAVKVPPQVLVAPGLLLT